jgi:hypothetical protein
VTVTASLRKRRDWIDGRPQLCGCHECEQEWDKWLSLFASRNEVAIEYARMLKLRGASWTGWGYVNKAILRRWSPAGLRYIKEKAWKLAAI